VSQASLQTHVQDVVLEHVEMHGPSTTYGKAITHFCVARRQCVNVMYTHTTL